MDKILTVEQVAEALQVKAITVREMFRDKRIRGFKVGKAWRTTEKMLQEDIEAIARGDSPADLPMLGTEAAARDVVVPKRGRKQAVKQDGATNGEAAPQKPSRAKKTAEAKQGSNGHARRAAAVKPEPALDAEEQEKRDQQLLF